MTRNIITQTYSYNESFIPTIERFQKMIDKDEKFLELLDKKVSKRYSKKNNQNKLMSVSVRYAIVYYITHQHKEYLKKLSKEEMKTIMNEKDVLEEDG